MSDQSTDPADSIDPDEPTEPTERTDPSQPAEPDARAEHSDELGTSPGDGQPPIDTTHDPTGLNLARTIAGAVGASRIRKRRQRREPRPEPRSAGAHPDDRDPQLLGRAMDRLVESQGWSREVNVHLLLGKWGRGLLLFAAIITMYALGLGLDGKVYQPNTGDLLAMLGFVGQLGMGLLYALARLVGWGSTAAQTTLNDYGTKFLVGCGLLNFIAAVDAHSLASGRKAS